MTTKVERLQAAIGGEMADRPPVALWRHFPVDDQDSLRLAQATIAFQKTFDFDFIKVTPASSFCIRDYGVKDEWRGSTEGTRDYISRPIRTVKDWDSIEILDPEFGGLGSQLKCLANIHDEVGNDTPFIQTIFNPLSQAKNLAGTERFLSHLHQDPKVILRAFDRITKTTIAFIERAHECGISGIFYAVQFGSYQYFTPADYAEFGEPFDRRILEAAGDLWLNVLHLHGEDLLFHIAETYPIQVVNWHDRDTPPNLAGGKSRISAAVCGGLSRWKTMVLGEADAIRSEAHDAMKSLDGGRGMILGTGCVVPIIAPYGNLFAAREAVESFS